jgi:hypothetical protein
MDLPSDLDFIPYGNPKNPEVTAAITATHGVNDRMRIRLSGSAMSHINVGRKIAIQYDPHRKFIKLTPSESEGTNKLMQNGSSVSVEFPNLLKLPVIRMLKNCLDFELLPNGSIIIDCSPMSNAFSRKDAGEKYVESVK